MKFPSSFSSIIRTPLAAAAFFLLLDAPSSAAVSFRLPDASPAANYLGNNKLLPFPADVDTRLEYAAEVLRLVDEVAAGAPLSSPQSYRRLETLAEEFKDEIRLLRVKNLAFSVEEERRRNESSVTGRFSVLSRHYYGHPSAAGGAGISPAVYLGYVAADSSVFANLGLRSASGDFGGMKVDEANVSFEFARGFGRVKVGRIYFLLGHLGLIGDNNFDAFEGAAVDLAPASGAFKFTGIYSRLSTTNYPRTYEFESCDDYFAARVSKEFARGKFETGLNMLFSGIASEDAASVDFYWSSPWKREFVLEAAAYRPTKSGIAEPADPYDPRIAVVGGFDAVNSGKYNVFVQLGSVGKGFAPMATSLAYSAQDHLYFDVDTRGFDVSLTYFPSSKLEAGAPWQTRPERTGAAPQRTFYEANVVCLWDSAWRKSQNRYILRHSRPFAGDLRLYIENTVWDRAETDYWPSSGVYDELKIYLTLEL